MTMVLFPKMQVGEGITRDAWALHGNNSLAFSVIVDQSKKRDETAVAKKKVNSRFIQVTGRNQEERLAFQIRNLIAEALNIPPTRIIIEEHDDDPTSFVIYYK